MYGWERGPGNAFEIAWIRAREDRTEQPAKPALYSIKSGNTFQTD